jgi:hypothetical protein
MPCRALRCVVAAVLQACPREPAFPEPAIPVSSRAEVFLGYLDYFRSRLVNKLEELPAGELRHSRLPSGWTPIELLKLMAYDEMRAAQLPAPAVSSPPTYQRPSRSSAQGSPTWRPSKRHSSQRPGNTAQPGRRGIPRSR